MSWLAGKTMLGLVSRRSREANLPPTMQETMQETAQTHLAKEAKLNVAQNAVLVEDVRQLAQDDRDAVRDYKARFGRSRRSAGKGNGMSDLIVCDDYRRGLNPWVVTALAVVVGVVMLGRDWLATTPLEQAEPAEAVSFDDQNTLYQLRFADDEAQ